MFGIFKKIIKTFFIVGTVYYSPITLSAFNLDDSQLETSSGSSSPLTFDNTNAINYTNGILSTLASGENDYEVYSSANDALTSNGWIEFALTEGSYGASFGFDSDMASGFTRPYQFVVESDHIAIYENGSWISAALPDYQVGDIYRLTRSGSVVTYSRNGNDYYTSQQSSTGPLRLGGSFYGSGVNIGGVSASFAQTGEPYYEVASGDTWPSIAEQLYGSVTAAEELEASLNSPELLAGLRLTGFLPILPILPDDDDPVTPPATPGGIARDSIRQYTFNHSLWVHSPSETPNASAGYWVGELALANNTTYAWNGQFGQPSTHALPPIAQLGSPNSSDVYPPGITSFSELGLDNILFMPPNFIQSGVTVAAQSDIASAQRIIDWVISPDSDKGQQSGIPIYIYEHWQEAFSDRLTPAEWQDFHDVTRGDYHQWFLSYQNQLMALYPSVDIRMIPVGPIIADILQNPSLQASNLDFGGIDGAISYITQDSAYEDGAPHGTTNLYFLAGLIAYQAMYGQPVVDTYSVPAEVSDFIANDFVALNSYVWERLAGYNSNGVRIWPGSVVNRAPVLSDFSAETAQNTATVIVVSDIMAGVSDPDGDTVVFVDATDPQSGSIDYDQANGYIIFEPELGFTGQASFVYQVSDGQAISESTVAITVAAVNEPLDSDGDGVIDDEDAFPNDPTETVDSDGDGVGDNSDLFPNNPDRSANVAPVVANPIPNQNAEIGVAFNFTIPSNTFSDADGDLLTLSAGSLMPSWLSFDSSTNILQGTPDVSEALEVSVTAADAYGGQSTTTFTLTIAEDEQQVSDGLTLRDQTGIQELNDGAFIKNTADSWGGNGVFDFEETLDANTNGWFEFTALENTGRKMIGVSEPDYPQVSSHNNIQFKIWLDNDGRIRIYENQRWRNGPGTYQAGDIFRIEREEGVIRYLKNGELLYTSAENSTAEWRLEGFFYSEGASIGNATASFVNNIIDSDGDGVPDDEDVFPNDPTKSENTIPVVANPIADQVIRPGSLYTFQVPQNTFSDADGDEIAISFLSYGYRPDWLTFDASTNTFTGTTSNEDLYGVYIRGSDNRGGFISEFFIINVTLDIDNDGVEDDVDAFPNDPDEQHDTDSDGVGDNADIFPNEPNEQYDTDGDGVGDNADAFPNDLAEQQDTDSDGVGDNTDVFPNNPNEQYDTDGDGLGDNIEESDAVGYALSYTILDNLILADENIVLAKIESDSVIGRFQSLDTLPENTDGWVQFIATQAENVRTIEFVTTSFVPSIGFDLRYDGEGDGNIQLSGTNGGSIIGFYEAGDVLRIERNQGAISLLINSEEIYRSTDIINNELRVRGSIWGTDDSLRGVVSSFGSGRLIINYPDADNDGVNDYIDEFPNDPNKTSNAAPAIANPIPDQTIIQGADYSYQIPVNTFSDIDGDAITLSAGSIVPSWLSFNPATQTLSGTPNSLGVTDVQIIANDTRGGTAIDTFSLTIILADRDGDGVLDAEDDLPDNPYEAVDTDGDGVGDNTDVFPNDASEYQDTDGDGVGNRTDAFPYDQNEFVDTDGDGVGDNADVFPVNPNESRDIDNDGIGDNSDPILSLPETDLDLLPIAQPNSSGLSINRYDNFSVTDRELHILNMPRTVKTTGGEQNINAASTVVIIADNFSINNKVKLLGPAAEILFISTTASGNISCNQCDFENFLRVSLATTSTQTNLNQNITAIGTLSPNNSSSISINGLSAPGVVALDIITSQLTLNGIVETHQRAIQDTDGGYQSQDGGSLTIGTGVVNAVLGPIYWDYDTRQITRVESSSINHLLSGNIHSSGVKISASGELTVNTFIDTRSDLIASANYRGDVYIPQESIDIQTLSNDSLNISGDQNSAGLIKLKSPDDLSLVSLQTDINASEIELVAGGLLSNVSRLNAVDISVAGRDLVNQGVIIADADINLWSHSQLVNQYGGLIKADTIKLQSEIHAVRNGSRTPYMSQQSEVDYLFNLDNYVNQLDPTKLGTFYSLDEININNASYIMAPDNSAHMIANHIEVQSIGFENINPYYERSSSEIGALPVEYQREYVGQVSISAESYLAISAEEYILNSSAYLSVNRSDSLFEASTSTFVNERYRTVSRLNASEYTFTPFSLVTPRTILRKTASSSTVGSSPPGVIAALGNVNISSSEAIINNTAYLEIFGDAQFNTPVVNDIGYAHQGFTLDRIAADFSGFAGFGGTTTAVSSVSTPAESDSLFLIHGNFSANASLGWFRNNNPFDRYINNAISNVVERNAAPLPDPFLDNHPLYPSLEEVKETGVIETEDGQEYSLFNELQSIFDNSMQEVSDFFNESNWWSE